jgi:hypothetical protein
LPGSYVQVALPMAASRDIVISTNALIFRGAGVQVATVDGAGKVKLIPVTLGRNFGQSAEVIEGLKGSEQLVLNPPDALIDGDVVTVVQDAKS